jgi:hypothetical protein
MTAVLPRCSLQVISSVGLRAPLHISIANVTACSKVVLSRCHPALTARPKRRPGQIAFTRLPGKKEDMSEFVMVERLEAMAP